MRLVLEFISLVVLCSSFSMIINARKLVPSMYVFGDSIVDVGNNNYLKFSLLKANFPHNGIDFPGKKPAGRYSDGKNVADFLAEKVGLATSPPYLSLVSKGKEFPITGVSFASGGAGIINTTNKDPNELISSSMQSPSSQRTPSRASPRGKGKSTADRSRAKAHLQIEERAHWTSDLTKDFLQCCANDINEYGRTSNSLDPTGWFRVNQAFNAMTNSNYKRQQLKNRWDQLKRDWAAWVMLTESPSQTGLGWDKKKNTITAPKHWWGLMINRRKEAAKFREAGLEHKDLMERVFRDVTSMGQGAYVPRRRQERMEDVREDSRELESDGTNPLCMAEDPFETPKKRYKLVGGCTSMPVWSASYGSTHKSSATKLDLSDSINELLQKVSENPEWDDKLQRAEAVRRVKAMPFFRDMNDPEIEDMRWWALRHLEKIRKVEMFLACDTDRQRRKWLYLENRIAIEEHRLGRSKDPLPPPQLPPPTYD